MGKVIFYSYKALKFYYNRYSFIEFKVKFLSQIFLVQSRIFAHFFFFIQKPDINLRDLDMKLNDY